MQRLKNHTVQESSWNEPHFLTVPTAGLHGWLDFKRNKDIDHKDEQDDTCGKPGYQMQAVNAKK